MVFFLINKILLLPFKKKRDERVLTELEVDERYKVEELNLEESLQLFSWHAFRTPNPKNGYFQLSKSVVDHVQGLPLALEILGSHLFRRSQLEWESVVEKLRQIPHDQIQKKLRISFDTLDNQSKAIFLDIACFFIGMAKEYVMKILDGCGFFPVIGVSTLLERSLITIGQNDHKLKMHDLLQDMGREIVRELEPNHISRRSRLWFHQDVEDILINHTGTEAVEGLSLDVSVRKDFIVSIKSFAKMINLRLLKINSVRFTTGCYEKFSKQLRWLCWHRCPLKVLPSNLDLDNLAVLDMRFSNVKEVWKKTKFLHKLKILDLSYSIYLVKTPNFAGLSNLERLEFEGCTSLIKVHQSIGQLERLVFLNLAECNNLREFPDSICNLRSLETLNLSGCSKLSSFPEQLGKLKALRTLLANESAITQLPISFGLLKNLERLSLTGCKDEWLSMSLFSFFSSWISPKKASSSALLPGTFSHLTSLKELNLSHRNLSDNDISIDFGSLQFLGLLDLGGNKFYSLPVGISNHPRLYGLYLNDCTNLQSIPELPLTLEYFESRQCTSIYRYPNNLFNVAGIVHFKIANCPKTMEIWDLCRISPSRSIGWSLGPKSGVSLSLSLSLSLSVKLLIFITGISLIQGSFWLKEKYLKACIPGRNIPNWFDYKEMGASVLFRVPSLSTGETRAMIVGVVYSIKDEHNGSTYNSITIHFKNKTKGYETLDKADPSILDTNIRQDHTWISYMTPHEFVSLKVDEGDEIELSVAVHEGRVLVKKCGIHLPILQFQEEE